MGLLYDMFQIHVWGLACAESFFDRKEPGAAKIAIENIKQELSRIAKIPGGGIIVDDLNRARNSADIQHGMSQLRGLVSHLPGREQNNNAIQLGYNLGSSWCHCRKDGSDPNAWPKERQIASEQLGHAVIAYTTLTTSFPQMHQQLVVDIMSLQNQVSHNSHPPYDIAFFAKFTTLIGSAQIELKKAA